MHAFKGRDKRRPVLVLSRNDVIDLLHTVMVAPITSTIHGAPSEVIVGQVEGLKHTSAINLDHIQTVQRGALSHYIGHLAPARNVEVCRALAIATGCDG